jgi:hypothetical protein
MLDKTKLIHQAIKNATVKIFVDDAFQGTGFFITSDGYILTAYHCIGEPPPDDIVIETHFAGKLPAQLDNDKSLKNKDFDIAVLKVNYSSPHYLPLGRVSAQHIPDDIVAFGYPAAHRADNQQIGTYSGKISKFRDDNRIENDAMKGQGQSGGPVYHYATHRVVGLASAGYKQEIMTNAGLAVRFEPLFENWPELELINHEVAKYWDERLERGMVEGPNIRLITLKQKLTTKRSQILPIWISVRDYLKNLEKIGIDEDAKDTLDIIDDFLAGPINKEEFIEFWQQNFLNATLTETTTLNYAALAEKLQHGEIVIFLGSNLSHEIGPELAKDVKYQNFNGSFSEICEYVELNAVHYGRTFLSRKIPELIAPIQSAPLTTSLYELLIKSHKPLIVIYAGYDSSLEETFLQAHKKFVVLSHSHHSHEIGTVFLKYSDQFDQSERCSAESLSGLGLLESGYSIIYKINGCFQLNTSANPSQKDSLMLSEQDYFEFAHYMDRLIPDYLARQLKERSFWFLDQYPQTWENRLIMQAILAKRQNQQGALAIHKNADSFANTYWKSKGVDNYSIELWEFIDKLKTYMPKEFEQD